MKKTLFCLVMVLVGIAANLAHATPREVDRIRQEIERDVGNRFGRR